VSSPEQAHTPAPPDPVFLATATEIVLRAGELQLAGQADGFRVEKKSTRDLVTEIDLACERMARSVIGERFPDHDILAEEQGGRPGGPTSSHCWVFDPLDGTTNFAHGLPVFCASLALEIDGDGVAAAIFDPSRQELFTAERGAGAYLNGKALRVSETSTLIEALLVTGFPYDLARDQAELMLLFDAFLMEAQAVRRLGSAALDLCYVAAGRFDGFWERRLWPWDVAAGTLIITEAGGQVSQMDGEPFRSSSGQMLATNGQIHAEMLAVIGNARALETGRG
jgi:myo-inositol-1(or 4)-monophosphatase